MSLPPCGSSVRANGASSFCGSTRAAISRVTCAELGPGAVAVDSWGDDPAVTAAYEELGFTVVERSDGWERVLD
jgi:hypothetical protein